VSGYTSEILGSLLFAYRDISDSKLMQILFNGLGKQGRRYSQVTEKYLHDVNKRRMGPRVRQNLKA
jgi:hypothetical protein